MSVDPVDDLSGAVALPAVLNERGLEPAITPQFRQPGTLEAGFVDHDDPASVVRHRRDDHGDRDQQTGVP